MATPDGQQQIEPDEIDPHILAETRRIYRQWLAIPEQEAILAEAGRLDELTERQAQRLEAETDEPDRSLPAAEWTVRRAERIRGAWMRARSIVLEEQLYPQVTPEIQAEVAQMDAWLTEQTEQERRRLREAKDPDRWRTQQVEVSELADRIVDRIWPMKPADFLPLASALIQQRLEDNERTPTVPEEPIAAVLEDMIEQQIAATPKDQLPF